MDSRADQRPGPVRAADRVARGQERSELEGHLAEIRRRLRPVRQRQDRAQGHGEPVRDGVNGCLLEPEQPVELQSHRHARVERRQP